MSEKDFEISRRKALAGIGVVGVASAGAGLGTTAYFSDEEEFTGNTITAGEFSMTVDPGDTVVNQDGGPDEGGVTEEGGAFYQGSINITDAKPGDDYEFCWDITLNENPGYVAVFAADVTNEDGSDDVNVGDIYDLEEGDLETLEDHVNATVTVTGPDETSSTSLEYENLGTLLTSLQSDDGVPISHGEDSLIEFGDGDTVTVCVELDIPTDVGNEIQGASTSADLIFYAEQARHNDASSFPNDSPVDDNGEENGSNGD